MDWSPSSWKSKPAAQVRTPAQLTTFRLTDGLAPRKSNMGMKSISEGQWIRSNYAVCPLNEDR